MEINNENEWRAEDVKVVLINPVYAFGVVYEPIKSVVEWIAALNVALPEDFWEQPIKIKLELYESFFQWLEDNGLAKRVRDDVPPMVDIETWLRVQKKIVDDDECNPSEDKLEAVEGFLQAAAI